MSKGPQLNYIKKNFTTRDSLGIEGALTSMTAVICPVVNTVTPRAFYWPFMVWIYYDYYKNSGIKDHNITTFDLFLKRQDYFFVLATLLNEDSDRMNLVGITQGETDIKNPGPYPFNPKYFQTTYGGMQYYNAGCLSMLFITDRNDDGKTYPFPKLTRLGEEMAISFENVIKDTKYYKYYRIGEMPVPRDVLIEYGKSINMGLVGFDESKRILKHRLFEINGSLNLCAEYLKYLNSNYYVNALDREKSRLIFFDHLVPSGERIEIPERLDRVSRQWEIVIGRQYFQCGLEMIWKVMLELLGDNMSLNRWIEKVLDYSLLTWDINNNLDVIIKDCSFDFDTREKMISIARGKNNHEKNLEDGIKIILSVYNWMNGSLDKDDGLNLLKYGSDTNSISLEEFYDTVEKYKSKTVKEFILYVMKDWLINQHFETAFEKMMQGRDGFYFEIVDGNYSKRYDFDIGFQGVRMIQLMQVMKDLDMFD